MHTNKVTTKKSTYGLGAVRTWRSGGATGFREGVASVESTGVKTVLPRRWGGQYRTTERPKMFLTGSGPLQGHKFCTVTFAFPRVVKSKMQTQHILCAKINHCSFYLGLGCKSKNTASFKMKMTGLSQDPPHAAGYTDGPLISKYWY